MAKVFLIPKTDVKVPLELPSRGFLPAAGDTVEMSVYWQRILNDGDVTIGTEPTAAPTKNAKAPTTTTA